jgi:hypothetical protein
VYNPPASTTAADCNAYSSDGLFETVRSSSRSTATSTTSLPDSWAGLDKRAQLRNGEWVAYDINVATPQDGTIEVALAQPATDATIIDVAVDSRPVPLRMADDNRLAGSVRLDVGHHWIRLTGPSQKVRVRWLDVC